MSTVVLADSDFPDVELERGLVEQAGFEFVVAESSELDSLLATGEPEGLLVMWAKVDAAMLDALPSLRGVGRFGVGVDSIDVEHASKLGVPVVHSGAYATEEVALHAVAMALALLRRLPAGDREARAGRWISEPHFRGIRRLSDLRAGIVGVGRIGARAASHFAEFGMEVAGYDPLGGDRDIEMFDSLDGLLKRSDLVSLHLPLTDENRHILDARRLALLPQGAVVVNAARGGLIDEDALAEALERGHLGAAGLDVFESEPLPADAPLVARDDVLLSPHVGYFSEEALLEARTNTVTNLISCLRGERPADIANPQVLDRARAS